MKEEILTLCTQGFSELKQILQKEKSWSNFDMDFELALVLFLGKHIDGMVQPEENDWQNDIHKKLSWSSLHISLLTKKINQEPQYDLDLFKIAPQHVEFAVFLYTNLLAMFMADNQISQEEQNFLAQVRQNFFPQGSQSIEAIEQKFENWNIPIALEDWYTQNSIIRSTKQDNSEVLTLSEAMEKLNALVGISNVKEEIQKLANFLKIQKERKKHDLPPMQLSMHMVFTGNPGTGKTTVARIVASIFRALGVLKKGHLIETDRSGLVGQYIGHTESKTNAIVQKALGGILFIDEAYSLYKGSENDYGQEAIDTIVKLMEDHRHDLVVIVAGYNDEMQEFIEANPGLRSRFNTFISFENYTIEELAAIFSIFAKKNGYELQAESWDKLKSKFSQALASADSSFGNGRYIRNLFERILRNQAMRLALLEKVTKADLITILPADIQH